jgi:hypothetical protein
LVRFTIKDLREKNCQYSLEEEQDKETWFANGIIAIPPFVTAALMHANSTDANDLFLVIVNAIKEVLEMEADNEEAKKNMLSHLVYIPQWLFMVLCGEVVIFLPL